jgi:hypothetical protein
MLGQAQNAGRALLDRALADTGLSYGHWVTLKLAADSPDGITRANLTTEVADITKVPPDEAEAFITDLTTQFLLTDQPPITPTPAGASLYAKITSELQEIASRIYDQPTEDLLTAARVITTITARANAELAKDRR